ncbi:MAG: hypothetical protein JSR77_11095 [Planctomycetes bacterium]|nr:hypothetical protein [Planctomycetota bacterium]
MTAADPTKPAALPLTINLQDPILRWQAFPRAEDEKVLGSDMRSRISDVRYDVKIWKVQGPLADSDHPTVVTGLTQPQFRITGLSSGETYRWTVRATFKYDHKPRSTQWCALGSPVYWDTPNDHPTFKVVDPMNSPKRPAQ